MIRRRIRKTYQQTFLNYPPACQRGRKKKEKKNPSYCSYLCRAEAALGDMSEAQHTERLSMTEKQGDADETGACCRAYSSRVPSP